MRETPCSRTASMVEILDRVLDKGIVIDASVQVAVAGLRLVDIDARIVVASLSTYVQLGDAVGRRPPAARRRRARRDARRASVSRRDVLGASAHADAPTSPGPPGARTKLAAVRRRARVRCERGCTFGAAPGLVACPYAADRTCVLARG